MINKLNTQTIVMDSSLTKNFRKSVIAITVLIISSLFILFPLNAEPNPQQSLYVGGSNIPEPVQIVESQTNILLNELSNREQEFDDDPKKLIVFARDVALSHWDLPRASRLILGPYWKGASKEQRQLFVQEFLRTLLRYVVRAYGFYDDSLVEILSYNWKPAKKGGWVQSVIQLPAGLKVNVDYRMHLNATKQWKLIDVRVEGISLVQSKKGEYRELAHDKKFNGLIKVMSDKNKDIL